MRHILVKILSVYQYLISPLLGHRCRFFPSCSDYAKQAINGYGSLKGSFLTVKRICKCHPFHPGGYDPVPEKSQMNRREFN